MAVTQLPDGRWCVEGRKGFFPDAPDRRRKYFGRGPDAERAAHRLDAELTAQGRQRAKRQPRGATFAELAHRYIDSKRIAGQPVADIEGRLESTILPAIGNRIAASLEHSDLDRYVSKRRQAKVKPSTITRELTVIKAIINFACKAKPPLLLFNPVAGHQGPAVREERILPPSPEEAARIYREAAKHLKRVIILSWYLGLRPGAVELLSLTWEESVRLEPAVIRIRSAHKGGPEVRDVPVHPGLLEHLKAWHAEDRGKGFLIHYHGRRVHKLRNSWRNACTRAGIKRKLRPYDMRHAFVTSALESGADIKALAEIVGSRPETLRKHYQHVSDGLTRRTVELVPGFEIDKKALKKRPSGGKKAAMNSSEEHHTARSPKAKGGKPNKGA